MTDSIFIASMDKHLGTCYYSGSQLCEIQGDLKKIGYTYFDYEKEKGIGNIKSSYELSDYHSRSVFSMAE